MSVETLKGPDRLVEGFEAALTFNYSAVIVTGGIHKARRMFARGRGPHERGHNTPAEILRTGVPSLSRAESLMRTWAAGQNRDYKGIGQGRQQSGGVGQHFDGHDVSPLAFSIDIAGDAAWRTQLASPDCIADNGVFDPAITIDDFEQGPDDIVIIPGMPHPSIHETTAPDSRLTRVFVTVSDLITAPTE